MDNPEMIIVNESQKWDILDWCLFVQEIYFFNVKDNLFAIWKDLFTYRQLKEIYACLGVK